MTDQIRVPDLLKMKSRGERIVALTAYDYAFARLVDASGAHITLIGDSLGNVVQGLSSTLPVTVDEIIYHTKAVVRGTQAALVISDLPFMSYQTGVRDALHAAGRLLKEGGAAGVKLEGGVNFAEHIAALTKASIPVMGHVGLTPQSFHTMGGYRVQGRGEVEARKVFEDAKAVEQAGAFAVVLEGIPSELAKEITDSVAIPTIGIGAGPHCSGQILVLHDVLGLFSDEGQRSPKFVKQYARLHEVVELALKEYAKDVASGAFPATEHSYKS